MDDPNLLRYTRALHRLKGVSSGAVLLSSALVELSGKGVAIAGGSRVGKTSLALALAANGVFISNDDLALKPDGSRVIGLGGPRSTSVRLDTFDVLFGKSARSNLTRGLEHPANATLPELIAQGIEPQGTVLLYPFELENRLPCQVSPGGQVDIIVFPRMDDALEEPVLSPLSQDEAAKRLAEFRFSNPVQHADFIPRDQFRFDDNDFSATIRRIANSLASYEFAFKFTRLRSDAQMLARAVGES